MSAEADKTQQHPGRFDYIRYDEDHTNMQAEFKTLVQKLAENIEAMPVGRYRSLAITSLEETYMWIGKAIRDRQIEFGGNADDVPERGESIVNGFYSE